MLVWWLWSKSPPFNNTFSNTSIRRVTAERTSPQVLIEKFASSSVCQRGRGGVVVRPVMSGKRVMLTRIAVNGCVRFFCQRCLDLRLRRLGDEFVLLAKVHQHGRAQAANFAEVVFRVSAMVGNG